MILDQAKSAHKLYRQLREAEDKIEFFKQFIPKDEKSRYWLFLKAKSPKLVVVTEFGTDDYKSFYMDDEATEFLIKSYEAKRDRILREIDAL